MSFLNTEAHQSLLDLTKLVLDQYWLKVWITSASIWTGPREELLRGLVSAAINTRFLLQKWIGRILYAGNCCNGQLIPDLPAHCYHRTLSLIDGIILINHMIHASHAGRTSQFRLSCYQIQSFKGTVIKPMLPTIIIIVKCHSAENVTSDEPICWCSWKHPLRLECENLADLCIYTVLQWKSLDSWAQVLLRFSGGAIGEVLHCLFARLWCLAGSGGGWRGWWIMYVEMPTCVLADMTCQCGVRWGDEWHLNVFLLSPWRLC